MGKVEKVDDVIQEGTFNDGDQTIAVTVGLKLETYSLKSYPKQDAGAVVAAKQEVIGDVSLETMLTDLERAGDMLYLAFVGLKGTKLAGRVGTRQKELAILCSDCVAAMRALESGSRKVVGSLIKAFKWLQKGQEARALKVVQRCGKEASNMSEKCTGLAGRFEVMSKETKEDSEMTENALAAEIKKIEEIKAARIKLSAKKAEQEAIKEQTKVELDDLNVEIKKEEDRENAAANRALISNITGSLLSAAGAGLGAYVKTVTAPVALVASAVGGSGGGGQPSDADKSQLNDMIKKANQSQAESDAKKKAFVDATKAAAVAKESLETAQVTAKIKEEALKEAKAPEKKKALADVENANKEVKDAEKDLKKKEEEKATAEEEYKTANLAVTMAQTMLDSLSQSMGDVANRQRERATQFKSQRMEMLKTKREKQKIKTAAIVELAKVTALIEGSKEKEKLATSTKCSLDVASWALSNVFAALTEAKEFWEKMTEFCNNLANNGVLEEINDTKEFEANLADRKEYYNSEDFCKTCLIYLVRWAALSYLCKEYEEASDKVKKGVLNDIRNNPDVDKAPQLAKDLKAKVVKQLAKDKADAESRTKALDEMVSNIQDELQDDPIAQ